MQPVYLERCSLGLRTTNGTTMFLWWLHNTNNSSLHTELYLQQLFPKHNHDSKPIHTCYGVCFYWCIPEETRQLFQNTLAEVRGLGDTHPRCASRIQDNMLWVVPLQREKKKEGLCPQGRQGPRASSQTPQEEVQCLRENWKASSFLQCLHSQFGGILLKRMPRSSSSHEEQHWRVPLLRVASPAWSPGTHQYPSADSPFPQLVFLLSLFHADPLTSSRKGWPCIDPDW